MQETPEDIVILSLFRSDSPYSSTSLSLAKEFAKQRRVFYVNHPLSLKDLVRRAYHARAFDTLWRVFTGKNHYEAGPDRMVVVHPPCTLPINWLPPGAVYGFFQRINNAVMERCIRRVKRDFEIKNYAYLNCYDPFFLGTLPKRLGARCSVYQCVDDITQDAYTHKHGTQLQAAAIRDADLTLATSTKLSELCRAHSPRVAVLHNAADITVFRQAYTERFARPEELAGHDGPVIGFFGNFDALRIDYPLLLAVARRFPRCLLLLIGPVNSPAPHALGLDALPNVRFVGPRKLAELPAYLQHIDVALIPFVCNTLTASIYPLKINEYLAAGKPVVSSDFSVDIRQFEADIYIAENHDAFLEKIELALTEQDPERVRKRVERAQSNSWTARAAAFWELVGKL